MSEVVEQISPLRRWRREQGLTLEQMAAALGASKGRLSSIENGASCSYDLALAIEKFTRGAVRMSDLHPDNWPAPPQSIGTEG